MAFLLPAAAVLIPLLTLPFWLFYFDLTPKIVALVAAAGIGCLLAPWRFGDFRALGRTGEGRRVILLLFLQAAAVCISTVLSTNPALSTGGSNWRIFGLITQLALLVFMLLAAAAFASGRIQRLTTLRAITLSALGIAVYAILQYFGWDPLLPVITYHVGEGEWAIVRPPGTIGHADYLGCYLVFALFLGGSLALREAGRWRVPALLLIPVGSFAILLSGTRSAMLGLAVGAGLLAVRYRPSVRRTLAVLLAGLMLLAGFYYSPSGLKLRARARWFREDPAGGARLSLWRDSLGMVVNRPLAGWGPETFSTEFPRFQSLALARAYPDFYSESPHNILLDELVSKGVAGALPFLLWCLLAGAAAWRVWRDGSEPLIGAGFFAGLFTLQFNAFVLTTAFVFFFTSILLLIPGRTEPRTGPDHNWLSLLGAAPLALLFLLFAGRLLLTDLLLASVRAQLEAGNVVAASSVYESVRRWDPRPGSGDLYYSRRMGALVRRQPDLLRSVKAWQEAVQAGIRATREAEDRQNAFYHLAALYAQVNDHKDAEQSLRGAIHSAPNWFKPHWMLAQVLLAGGRQQEALAEAEAAVERDGGKHAEVAETLRQLQRNK